VITAEPEIIAALETLMAAMEEQGFPTASMWRFFGVGEWLLCFEGAWRVARNDPAHPLRQLAAYRDLHAWFADDLV
jgi:hypothetical protein